MRPGRGKNVASVEGGGERGADHPCRIGDLAGGDDAVAVLDESKQAIVGQHEELADAGLGDDRLASAADAGVDHNDEDRVFGEIGGGAGEKARALLDVERCNLLGDVDDADARRHAFHDRFADADGVVLDVEVGHEADGAQGSCYAGRSLRRCENGRDQESDQESER